MERKTYRKCETMDSEKHSEVGYINQVPACLHTMEKALRAQCLYFPEVNNDVSHAFLVC